MNLADVVISLVLVYGLWKGYSSGILIQLSGIAGLILGAWVAGAFSDRLMGWFDIGAENQIVVFLVVVIIVMIGVIFLLRLLDKVFQWGGVGFPIRLLGSLFCVAKYFFVMAFLLSCYSKVMLFAGKPIKSDSYIVESFYYEPLQQVSGVIFPYIIDYASSVDIDKLNRSIEKHFEDDHSKDAPDSLSVTKDSVEGLQLDLI